MRKFSLTWIVEGVVALCCYNTSCWVLKGHNSQQTSYLSHETGAIYPTLYYELSVVEIHYEEYLPKDNWLEMRPTKYTHNYKHGNRFELR